MELNWEILRESLDSYKEACVERQNRDVNHAYSVEISADIENEFRAAELTDLFRKFPVVAYSNLAMLEYIGNMFVSSPMWRDEEHISEDFRDALMHFITMMWFRLCHEAIRHTDPETANDEPPYLSGLVALQALEENLPDFSDILNQFDN